MRIELKWLVVLGVLALVLVAGAYRLGLRSVAGPDPAPAQTTIAPPAPAAPFAQASGADGARAGRLAPGASMPANHPSPAGAGAAPPAGGRAGVNFTHFRVGNRNIKTILADGGVVWVGTSGGVIRYDTANDQHRLFDVRSGLLSNGVFHLSKLDDRVAVGTYGGGLSLFDPATESWDNYNIQHGLGDAFVYDMLQTTSGDIWVATWSGANRVRGGALRDRASWDLFTVENTSGGLPNDWVYGLAEGRDGVIWLATEGGLARFENEQWQNWNHTDGLGAPFEQVRAQIQFTRDPAKESSHHARQKAEQGLGQVDVAYNPNYIVSLLVDREGIVWAGTWGGGLARFDGQTWRNFTVDDGLPANHVFMLRQDHQGRMWVGTSKGLARLEGDRFEVYSTADGLFAENVFSMAEDQTGKVWVGSFGGVARIEGL